MIDKKLTERTIIFIFKLSLIIFIHFVILKTIVFAVIHTFCFIFWLTLYKSSWRQRQICQIEMSCLHGFKDKLLFFPWIFLFLSNIIGFSHLNSVFQRAYEIVQSSKCPYRFQSFQTSLSLGYFFYQICLNLSFKYFGYTSWFFVVISERLLLAHQKFHYSNRNDCKHVY